MHKMARILVIDDDALVRAVIKAALSDEGYEVMEAADGKEGLKCYRNFSADLVITDLIMPEQEGIETIIELCREWPEVKIIAISGGPRYGSNDTLRMAELLGAKRAIAKPFKIPDLLAAVCEVLG